MSGLYIHIPFCRQACHYCNFHFSVNTSRMDDMASAICAELALRSNYLRSPELHTIYWGGGTPSLLHERQLTKIASAINRHFTLRPGGEVTLEANPDDLSKEKLDLYKRLGIRRLSIGVQSFNDASLRLLNRSHTGQMALQYVRAAQEAGFDSISLDLMYGVPGRDHKVWEADIRQTLALKPEHLSAYALTIEEKTVFGRWLAKGRMPAVDESFCAEQLEQLAALLDQAGYEHYEVSNFCRQGYRAAHNSSYWSGDLYLGVGPGAHSFNGAHRRANAESNAAYLAGAGRGEIPHTEEVLSRENLINEYILLSLRTHEGCDLNRLRNERHIDIASTHSAYLHRLEEAGLATISDNGARLRLTLRGKLLADKITVDLMIDTPTKASSGQRPP